MQNMNLVVDIIKSSKPPIFHLTCRALQVLVDDKANDLDGQQ